MEYGTSKLDMAKMPWTLSHTFTTCLTLEVPVYGTHPRVHQATKLGFMRRFIHDFGVFNFSHGVRFLQRR